MSILMVSGILLAACNTTDEDGTVEDLEENWAQYIQEGSDTLENYGSDTDIALDLALGPDLMTDEDEVWITAQIIGDLDKGYIVTEEGELYFDGNDAHQLEGNTWVYYPDSGPIEYASWYPNIVGALTEIEGLIEANHADGNLALTYEGNDPEVWSAFEEEFDLSIDGISSENISIALDATVDEDSYYLQDITLDILGEETENDVKISSVAILIEVDYFDHDEIDLTEIEEEISTTTE